jgi:hypothetical protein
VNIQGTLRRFRDRSGNIQVLQGTFREHSGNIQGTFRYCLGFTLGPFLQGLFCRERSGKIQELFIEHSGNIQGTFRFFTEHSGNILEAFRVTFRETFREP